MSYKRVFGARLYEVLHLLGFDDSSFGYTEIELAYETLNGYCHFRLRQFGSGFAVRGSGFAV